MRFAEADAAEGPLIRAYGPGWIRVEQTEYRHPLALGPEGARAWPPERPDEIDADALQPLLAEDPEVLILGTGGRPEPLSPAFLTELTRRGTGVEVMATAAACRTYNILVGEGRRVAAGLLLIPAEDRS